MIRLVRVFCLISFLAASETAYSQVQTGLPPFGSFGGGPDAINLANLNAHLTIPVLHKPGRGTNFVYDLSYDSSIWYPVTSGSTKSWNPVPLRGWPTVLSGGALSGYITYFGGSGGPVCYWTGGAVYMSQFTNFVYTEYSGLTHALPGQIITYNVPYNLWHSQCPNLPPPTNNSISGFTTDGSGFYYSLSANSSTITSANITSPSGTNLVPQIGAPTGAASSTDRNGNQSTFDGQGRFYDTLSSTTPVLSIAGSGTPASPYTLSYVAPSGANAAYTVKYTAYTVQTKFGCSGITEYGPTSNNLVSEIDLPDGSKYAFSYEPTPGVSGNVTGRLASVTLLTGGTISYSYTGGSNGINCSDGSTATLTRTTPDGAWTYAQVKGTGSASTTTVTDPQSNQTVIQFQGIYETQRQVYQGSTSGTPLETVNTCYNSSASPCTGTAVALPITRRTQIVQVPNASGKQSEHDAIYNSLGLVTEADDYDYGSGAVGALIRKTSTSYATLDRPASVTVQDGGSVTKVQTTFAYDETAATATSGTPQHVAVSGSRGNATTVKSYKNATNFLTSTATYFDTGNVQTATDVNGAQTTYTYGACGNSFPTSISEPLSLSKSETWNCTGGVLTSVTDENGKQSTIAYSDPYFWRPASSTDPTNAVTNLTYTGQTSVESSLSFNSGSSAVDVLTTLDGLGRGRVNQTRQAPGSSNFDSVEQDYDNLGRPSRSTLPYSGTAGQLNSTAPATTKTYDALGRVNMVTDGGSGNSSYSYTQNDVLVTVGPAPTGETTKRRQLEYDGLGRLTSVCEITSATDRGTCGQTVSQTGYWTKYTYDVLGNLLTVTQNAQAASGSQQSRSYTYDFLSRLTSETNPESGTTNNSYDTDATCGTSSGDRVKRVDMVGNVACFAYDALHRATSITYSGPYAANTPNKYFVYDAATVNSVAMVNGKTRLVEAYTATTQTGTKITDAGFSYSARGEVSDVYQSTSHSSGYYHVNQTYWPHGAPSQLSQLVGLPTISYGGTIGSTVGLDGEGRITQVTAGSGQNPVTGVVYNPYGAPPQTTVTFGSGDADVFSYDANTSRMTQYKFNINGQSDSGTLTWNANSTLQKLVISDAFNSTDSQTCTYGYDDIVRLASANCGTAAAQTFSYDPFGNINKSGSPYSFLPNYSSSTNHITTVGSVTATYDGNGNVTNDGVHTYSWDADGNSVTMDGVGVTYDALDRAVEKNNAGAYTQIVYAPTGAKLALMSVQTLQKAFVPLPGKASAIYTSSGLDHYRHSDWLGSARLTSTPSRTVSSTVAYAPFGESYAQSGTADASFTGQNSDTVAGDYDFLYREYSTQGRWPSPDPGGLATAHPEDPRSWNRYAYVRNNPLSLIDPLGLDCIYDNEDGTATIVRGDCYSSSDSGVFVDGTIDTNSPITFDPATGDLTFGLTNDNGAYGVGVALGFFDPQSQSAPDDGFSAYGRAFANEFSRQAAPLNKLSDCAGEAAANQIPFGNKILGTAKGPADPVGKVLDVADKLAEPKNAGRAALALNKAGLPELSQVTGKNLAKVAGRLAPYAGTIKVAGSAFSAGLFVYDTYGCYNKP